MSKLVLSGDTSGSVTLDAPAVSGTTTLTLPTTTGTLVVTSGAQTIEFADGSASTPSITNSGDTNTGMFFPAADTIAFAEGGTESMRIDSSGNVLVGATSLPTNASGLYVASCTSSASYRTRNGSAGSFGTNVFNFFWTGSALQAWVDSVNVGNVSLTSDYRIKKNIETQTAPALERVMALRPVTYQMADYKTLFKASDDIKEGFIAHEVQEVIPSGAEGVKDDENQIQSLRVDAILAVAVKAIQEQQTIINDLKARIEILEAK